MQVLSGSELGRLLGQALKESQEVIAVSPFVGLIPGISELSFGNFKLLTSCKVEDFLSGASDWEYLKRLQNDCAEIKIASGLHSKCFCLGGIT
jgi:hypothetical protein